MPKRSCHNGGTTLQYLGVSATHPQFQCCHFRGYCRCFKVKILHRANMGKSCWLGAGPMCSTSKHFCQTIDLRAACHGLSIFTKVHTCGLACVPAHVHELRLYFAWMRGVFFVLEQPISSASDLSCLVRSATQWRGP